MTPNAPEVRTRDHEPWETCKVPAQTFRNEFSAGLGHEHVTITREVFKDPPRVSVTLPPWLFDQIDFDEVDTETFSRPVGEMLLGPKAPPGASLGVKSACEGKQLLLRIFREDADMEDVELMAEEVERGSERVHDLVMRHVYVEDGDMDERDDLSEGEVSDLRAELHQLESAVRSLRHWLYEEQGVEP